MSEDIKRGRGRPRHFAEGNDFDYNLRLPREARLLLTRLAKLTGRGRAQAAIFALREAVDLETLAAQRREERRARAQAAAKKETAKQ